MISILTSFFFVLLGSALCSTMEAAILSLPLLRAKILAEQKRHGARDVLFLKENISEVVSAIVIMNNFINIMGAVWVGEQVAERFGSQWMGLASALLTVMIIVFGEIFPKAMGERYKISVALFFSKPLRVILLVLGPLVKLLLRLTKPAADQSLPQRVTEDEIKMMLKLGRADGTVEGDEEILCNRVFKLNDLRAEQLMRPISELYALPADKTLEDVRTAIIQSRYSRIGVYDKNPYDIVGVVQHRVLLREMAKDNHRSRVRDFMMQPIYVPSAMRADLLLEKFQAHGQHLFIVQDGRKNDIGLVTMEDVLEELFGEIYDEKDGGRGRFADGGGKSFLTSTDSSY